MILDDDTRACLPRFHNETSIYIEFQSTLLWRLPFGDQLKCFWNICLNCLTWFRIHSYDLLSLHIILLAVSVSKKHAFSIALVAQTDPYTEKNVPPCVRSFWILQFFLKVISNAGLASTGNNPVQCGFGPKWLSWMFSYCAASALPPLRGKKCCCFAPVPHK